MHTMPGPDSEVSFGMGLANEELLPFGSSMSLKDLYVEGLILHLSLSLDMEKLQKWQELKAATNGMRLCIWGYVFERVSRTPIASTFMASWLL